MKRILLIIITCAILLAMTSCSPDPRVAPFKAWIVGVEAPTVLYDEDYGTRVIIMKPGDEAKVTYIHNREPRHKVTVELPDSDEIYVAQIKDNEEGTFVIKAIDKGCSRISLNVKGEKVQYLYGRNEATAEVYVIVEDGEDESGITVKLSLVNGNLNTGGIDANLHVGDHMTFNYEDNSNIQVDHVDWYVNGIYKATGNSLDYNAITPGQHNVRCIIYGYRHGEWTLGHSDELQVLVNL